MFSLDSLKASMPATTGYFAWGCFRYFGWERELRDEALADLTALYDYIARS